MVVEGCSWSCDRTFQIRQMEGTLVRSGKQTYATANAYGPEVPEAREGEEMKVGDLVGFDGEEDVGVVVKLTPWSAYDFTETWTRHDLEETLRLGEPTSGVGVRVLWNNGETIEHPVDILEVISETR